MTSPEPRPGVESTPGGPTPTPDPVHVDKPAERANGTQKEFDGTYPDWRREIDWRSTEGQSVQDGAA